MKRIIINENQYNRLFETNHIASFIRMNPLSVNLCNLNEGKIYEGYYKTYPIENVLRYLEETFGNQIRVVNENKLIVIFVPSNSDYKEVNAAMGLCGYSLDGEFKYDDKLMKLQYSPRYSDDVMDKVSQCRFLYHVTPEYNTENILKYGFQPRSKNSRFKYPERVYLFLEGLTTDELLDRANALFSRMDSIVNPKDTKII